MGIMNKQPQQARLSKETSLVTDVVYKDDQKQRFTGAALIQGQDHTLGNVLRHQLLQDGKVRFAGYKKPHPLEEKIEIKVQTNGETAPPDAILDSCNKLNMTLTNLAEQWREEVARKAEEKAAAAENQIPG